MTKKKLEAHDSAVELNHAPLTRPDAELIQELLGDGYNAVQLLQQHGGLKGLFQSDALPRPLATALELSRRVLRAREERPKLGKPRTIYEYLAPTLSALRREVFHALCFNPRNVLLADVRVAEGTMNSCPVDPREVFAPALLSRATAIILAHNHPSGDPEPSQQDVSMTFQIEEAAALFGIKVLDHIIVGDGRYVSMMERGLTKFSVLD